MPPHSRNTGRGFWFAAASMSLLGGKAPERNVVIEFRDYETAVACHDSEEYREAAKLRDAASDADLVIVDSYDGPQPG